MRGVFVGICGKAWEREKKLLKGIAKTWKRKEKEEVIAIYMQKEEASYLGHVQNDVILVFIIIIIIVNVSLETHHFI